MDEAQAYIDIAWYRSLGRNSWVLLLSLIFTAIIHVVLIWGITVLDKAAAAPSYDGASLAMSKVRLCEGRRCPLEPFSLPMRYIDKGLFSDELPIIEAMVIPKLGMKEQNPKKLPKLQTYETIEKHEKGINIENDVATPKEIKKAPKKKKAKWDKKRPKKPSLAELLDASENPDKRYSATKLSDIVGHKKGSVHGSGSEFKEGNIYLGKMVIALKQQFTVPTYIDDETLKKLKVRIKVLEMDSSGSVLAYKLVKKSGNQQYDLAAEATIKKFTPSEGGTKSFPPPKDDVLAFINSKGILVDMDGKLFSK